MQLGRLCWVIPEGYIPPESVADAGRALESHETACPLNSSDNAVHVEIMLYFPDREPVGPYKVTVRARRTLHLRFNDLQDPEPAPRGADFSSVIRADGPIDVQHTRLDSRHPNVALLSTIAFPVG